MDDSFEGVTATDPYRQRTSAVHHQSSGASEDGDRAGTQRGMIRNTLGSYCKNLIVKNRNNLELLLNSPKLFDVGRKEMKMHLEFGGTSCAAKDASE